MAKEEVVTPDSTQVEEDVVEEVVQPEEVVESEPISEDLPGEVAPVEEDDEQGVPFKNRYYEMKRKEELARKEKEETTQLLREIRENQVSQEKKYSEAELVAFAARDDTDPAHAKWALGEADKIRNEKTENAVQVALKGYKETETNKRLIDETFRSVTARHPDIAIKDANGNFIAWNEKSKMAHRMAHYMEDPALQKDPRGLKVAAALAYEDLAQTKGVKTAAELQAQKRKVKVLQRKTEVESGTTNVSEDTSAYKTSVEQAKKTGSTKDTKNAFGQVLRQKGMIKD